MATTAQTVRTYRGPAILSFGFRPFFLTGAIWAAAAMALWIPMLIGRIELPSAFSPIEWHVHELVYGYVPAIAAGFLLTAVPNWTGRLPIVGLPLLALYSCWVAGRIAVLTSAWSSAVVAGAIDLMFLVALTAVLAREILAAENTRNLKILMVLAVLIMGNTIFHVESMLATDTRYGIRVGIAAILFLIMLIGGRIVPSFTRNWLARQEPGRMPVPFGGADRVVIAGSGLALFAWVAQPDSSVTAVLAVLASILNAWRLLRWAGERTVPEPLVLVLHVAYAFVPTGFVLLALGILRPGIVSPTGALHAWTSGAISLMTLAVMTRASLGHAGRELTATGPIIFIYCSALVAAITRIAAGFDFAALTMLYVSAAAWILAFLGFFVVYSPMLLKRSL